MKLLVLHVSDIHLRDTEIPSERVHSVAAALNRYLETPAVVVVAATGDIAFSGRPAEYDLAASFFQTLVPTIRAHKNVAQLHVLTVPGNHDCDFAAEQEGRGRLLKTITRGPSGDADAETVRTCLEVQAGYRRFSSAHSEAGADPPSPYTVARITVEKYVVAFHCCNSAWMSTLHEHQGELMFPVDTLRKRHTADLDIILFHHPLNWLQADNARALRKRLDETADLVLTGHEHDGGAFERRVISAQTESEKTVYVEGSVFNEHGSAESGFHVIEIQLDEALVRIHQFSLVGEMYSEHSTSSWRQLRRASVVQGLVISESFREFLDDPGTPYTHPYKRGKVLLQDLFVAPDVDVHPASDRAATISVRSEDALRTIMERDQVLVTAPEDAGKTAFLKRVAQHFLDSGIAVVWIDGAALRRPDATHLEKVVEGAISRVYGPEGVEKVLQLPPERKALLIDDVHLSGLNHRGQDRAMGYFRGQFEHLVLAADDLFQIQLLSSPEDATWIRSFDLVSIREFRYRLRGELIERWMKLGREETASASDIAHAVSRGEHVIGTLLGKTLFPSFPLFVLTALQSLEAASAHETANVGTYGYIYEALITARLGARREFPVDTAYNVLAFIAFECFDKATTELTEREFDGVLARYCERFRVRLSKPVVLQSLIESGILKAADGLYSFRYKYVYFYFVARYFREGLADPDTAPGLRVRCEHLVSQLHQEEAANVLLFLLYLTRDRLLLAKLREHARALYSGYAPATFGKEIEFVRDLSGQRAIKAPAGTHVAHRRELREARDEAADDDSHKLASELNTSMKAIQILGQVLRNFAGSLHGDLKADITKDVAQLGLRSLSFIFGLVGSQLQELRSDVARILAGRRVADGVRPLTPEALQKRTDEVVFRLVVMFARAVMKRVSFAIGAEELEQTYEDVFGPNADIAMRTIDAAIKLEHFRELPMPALEKLYREVRENSFAAALLRELVWDRLYVYPAEEPQRQRLLSTFEMKPSPKLLDQSVKQLMPRSDQRD